MQELVGSLTKLQRISLCFLDIIHVIKILLGEISITSDMQITPPLGQKVKKN